MSELVEPKHPFEFVLGKAGLNRSVENAILASGENLEAGTVLGRTVTAGTITGEAWATNTGDEGAISALSVGGAARPGIYKVVFIEPASNGGVFLVYPPGGEGPVVGWGKVPDPFVSDHISFTIADAADFVAGDGFDIKVSQLTEKFVAFDPAGTNGENKPAGILAASVDATDADKACVVVVADAEVNGHGLVWPPGIDPADKSIAMAQLAKLGVIIR